MIDRNIDLNICTGCKMCGDICAKGAISFEKDKVFWCPVVDYAKCISCGLCVQKCPAVNFQKYESHTQIKCYGLRSKDEKIRFESTSGGFFSILANYVILEKKGFCAGVVYDENNIVRHIVTNNADDIERLRQSKYSQSDTQGIYSEVKSLLKKGEFVLFCGTPCQTDALYRFLGKKYENLLTLDFICLGIPSPLVFRKYLNWIETKYKSKVNKVWFKYKTYGWRAISNRIDLENGKKYIRRGSEDPYMISFVLEFLNIRQSCDNCHYRHIPHKSDFTAGDFWGIEKINPDEDDNMGTTALFINSLKAQEIFKAIKNQFCWFEVTAEDICQGNFTTLRSAVPSPQRKAFLEEIETGDFIKTISKYAEYPIPLRKRIRNTLKTIKEKIKKAINGKG